MIEKMSTTDMVKVYNVIGAFNNEPSWKAIKKFKDRATAIERLQNISRGISRVDLMFLFDKAGVDKEIIESIPTISAPVAEVKVVEPETPPVATLAQQEAKLDKATSFTPPFKSAAKKTASPKPDVEAMKAAQKEAKKKPTPRPATPPPVPSTEPQKVQAKLVVLRAIRSLIPVNAKGEAATINSTQIARNLKTSITTVVKTLQQLGSAKLIRLEDDSPDDSNPLFYVSLTQAGLKTPLPAITAVSKTKLPSPNPGPSSKKSEKKIYKLGEWKAGGNPRREGTHGHKSFALIKDGMPYEKYKELGGRNNDLQWDIDHGYVEVR